MKYKHLSSQPEATCGDATLWRGYCVERLLYWVATLFRGYFVQRLLCSEATLFRGNFVEGLLSREATLWRGYFMERLLFTEAKLWKDYYVMYEEKYLFEISEKIWVYKLSNIYSYSWLKIIYNYNSKTIIQQQKILITINDFITFIEEY